MAALLTMFFLVCSSGHVGRLVAAEEEDFGIVVDNDTAVVFSAVRLILDGYGDYRSATYWNVHHRFELMVQGHNMKGGVPSIRRQNDSMYELPSNESNLTEFGLHTACDVEATTLDADGSLHGPLADGFGPLVERSREEIGEEVRRWQDQQVVRAGDFAVCWCEQGDPLAAGCMEIANFSVSGPYEFLNRDGLPLSLDFFAESTPYIVEPFALQVTGYDLNSLDRIRLVPHGESCGGAGTVGMEAIEPFVRQGASVNGLQHSGSAGRTGNLQTSLMWPGLTLGTSTLYRACWCSGVRFTDAPPSTTTTTTLPMMVTTTEANITTDGISTTRPPVSTATFTFSTTPLGTGSTSTTASVEDVCLLVAGGDWKLVRHTAQGDSWGPWDDDLAGELLYGTPGSHLAEGHWTIPWSFNASDFEFLFAFADCAKWLVATPHSVRGDGGDGFYGHAPREVRMSSASAVPYKAHWLYRITHGEDPSVSIADYPSGVLYTENSTEEHTWEKNAHGGANVYVRPVRTDACALVDGGGWVLVRHTAGSGAWGPWDDNLTGTVTHGYAGFFDSDFHWTVPWVHTINNETADLDNATPDEFIYDIMFAFSDCSFWLITTPEDVNGERFGDAYRLIRKSSEESLPYQARWLNDAGHEEHPLISLYDFPSVVMYAEASATNHVRLKNDHGGANVYIRGVNVSWWMNLSRDVVHTTTPVATTESSTVTMPADFTFVASTTEGTTEGTPARTSPPGEESSNDFSREGHLCSADADFDLDLGGFAVAGPQGMEQVDLLRFTPLLSASSNFSLSVFGESLEATARIRIVESSINCGDPGTMNGTDFLSGPLADNPDAPGEGVDVMRRQTWGSDDSGLQLSQGGVFRVCWCSGNLAGCTSDYEFRYAPGTLSVSWPGFFLQDGTEGTDGQALRVVPGVGFDVLVRGSVLATSNRIRILEVGRTCGSADSHSNVANLHPPMALDSDGELVHTADGHTGLRWTSLRVFTGGMHRICWCAGSSLADDAAHCTRGEDFYTEVGKFPVLEVRDAWPDDCARALRPFRFHVAAVGLRPLYDRALLQYGEEECGEGRPHDMIPGGTISKDFSWSGFRCWPDPNVGAVQGEAKMLCGDGIGSVVVSAPGFYRVCLCPFSFRYDCSDAKHFWMPAGEPFEVAWPDRAGASTTQDYSSQGSGSPPPMLFGGSGGAALAMAYAPAVPAEPHADRLAVASEDGLIRLWEPDGPRAAIQLVGHTARVNTLAWAPDASFLVSGSSDGTLRLWSHVAGVKPGTSQSHVCPFWEPIWSRASSEWVPNDVWQDDIFGHALDLEPRNVSQEARAFHQDANSPDDLMDAMTLSLRKAAAQCEKLCSRYMTAATRLCDCGPTFECHRFSSCVPKCGLEAHTWHQAHGHERVSAVAVALDAFTIASGAFDGSLHVWDVRYLADDPVARIGGHLGAVLCLAFSSSTANSYLLASGGGDAAALLHDVEPVLQGSQHTFDRLYGYPERTLGLNATIRRFVEPVGSAQSVLSVALSPSGEWLVTVGASALSIWDVLSGARLREVAFSVPGGTMPLDGIAAFGGVAFAPDNSWLAYRGPHELKLWPLNSTSVDPSNDRWTRFEADDLTACTLSWSISPGPQGNTPVYEVIRFTNGSIQDLRFTPCNQTSSCGQSLPIIRLDIEVPFEFTGIRGRFVTASLGPGLADDCRGGAPHAVWNDYGAGSGYWGYLGADVAADGPDCQRVGPADGGIETLEDCQRACASNDLCNILNFRVNPNNCDLRYCLNISAPQLRVKMDSETWLYVDDPTHDGYIMFGAPIAGNIADGVIYGGCGYGPNIPEAGVQVDIPMQEVTRTRKLRWQVAQSMWNEGLAIRDVYLELLRPDSGGRVFPQASTSPALAFSPTQRKLTAAVSDAVGGTCALWDMRGFDFSPGRTEAFELKSVFGFDLYATGLLDDDRIRIISLDRVPRCGSAGSATNSKAIQGIGLGQRGPGSTESHSRFDGLVATEPGNYRICYCLSREGTCCDIDAVFAAEVMAFTIPGAQGGHYFVCAATLAVGEECMLKDIKGVGLQTGDKVMLQEASLCGEATGPVPGLEMDGIAISRPYDVWFDPPYYEGGRHYRFEKPKPNEGYEFLRLKPTTADGTRTGVTAKLCWCSVLVDCEALGPAGFRVDAGLITIVHTAGDAITECLYNGDCDVDLDLLEHIPFTAGDLLMVKVGDERPEYRLSGCDGATLLRTGPAGDGISGRMVVQADGVTGTFPLGTITPEPGTYTLCWCQGSIRPCVSQEEFTYYVGLLYVVAATYVWPACTAEEPFFTGWRAWETFDDCCCNYHEAGAVGCLNTLSATYATCSAYPSR